MTKSGKHCGKRRNCTFCAISSFVTVFKKPSAAEASESVYMRERVKMLWPIEKWFLLPQCFLNLTAAAASNASTSWKGLIIKLN